jgi:hypothetical protein
MPLPLEKLPNLLLQAIDAFLQRYRLGFAQIGIRFGLVFGCGGLNLFTDREKVLLFILIPA